MRNLFHIIVVIGLLSNIVFSQPLDIPAKVINGFQSTMSAEENGFDYSPYKIGELDGKVSIQYGTKSGVSEVLVGSDWIISSRSFETFEDGLRKKYNYTYYDINDGSYSGHTTMSYFYNSEEKISESLQHKAYRTFYSYDNDGNLVEVLVKDAAGSINRFITIYSYDTNNYLTETIYKIWDGSSWINSSRTLYTNNSSGFPIERLYQYWNGNWFDQSKYAYSYDGNNNLIVLIQQRFISSTWENFSRNEYTYNVNNLRTEYIRQQWVSNQWQYNSKEEYYYDQNQDLIETRSYYYLNNNWEYSNRISYTISDNNFISVITPNKGQVFSPNSEISVHWVTLNVLYVDISFSSDGGVTWESIATSIPDTGDYEFIWTGYPLGLNNCKIKVSDSQNASIYAVSYDYFRILLINENYFLTHTTNNLQFSVFNNGYLGKSNSDLGIGFIYNGLPNPLYGAGIVLSTPNIIANGMISSFNISDFTNYSPMQDFTSNNEFNQIAYANIVDSNAPIPSGLIITQQTCSRENDDYIFVTYKVLNPSNETIENVYVGMFADWDIENSQTNLGGVDAVNKIIYQYQPNATNDNNYYGIACLSEFSGAKVSGYFDGSDRQAIFSFITNNVFSDITIGYDYRSFIGSGPFTIYPNETAIAGFAVLAASDINNLVSNTAEAQQLWDSGVVKVEDESSNDFSYSLYQNYPNPFNPITTISYSLPNNSFVQLKVYDILGREVVTLVNEEKTAGRYEINFDASKVSSGIYFYKLQSGAFIQTKKMILLK